MMAMQAQWVTLDGEEVALIIDHTEGAMRAFARTKNGWSARNLADVIHKGRISAGMTSAEVVEVPSGDEWLAQMEAFEAEEQARLRERRVLRIGPHNDVSIPKITSKMVEKVRQRITEAGGTLTVWGVLREDYYETVHGDGFFLTLNGVSLNRSDADRLATSAGTSEWSRWHVREYSIGLENDLPVVLGDWPKTQELLSLNDVVAILAEIPRGKSISKLCTGGGARKDGSFVTLPEDPDDTGDR